MREEATLQLGNTIIRYEVIRSRKRKKTVSLAWDRAGRLIIKAPMNTLAETLEGIAKKRMPKLIQSITSQDTTQRASLKEAVCGECISYLGRNYRLRIFWGESSQKCLMRHGWLEVYTSSKKSDLANNVWLLLETWFKKRAEIKIRERISIYNRRLNFKVNEVYIRNQSRRWASCDSKGNLRFNWRIIMAPISLVDYVVAHELCHLAHPNHSEDFWDLLWQVMPDYNIRREKLRLIGEQLNL